MMGRLRLVLLLMLVSHVGARHNDLTSRLVKQVDDIADVLGPAEAGELVGSQLKKVEGRRSIAEGVEKKASGQVESRRKSAKEAGDLASRLGAKRDELADKVSEDRAREESMARVALKAKEIAKRMGLVAQGADQELEGAKNQLSEAEKLHRAALKRLGEARIKREGAAKHRALSEQHAAALSDRVSHEDDWIKSLIMKRVHLQSAITAADDASATRLSAAFDQDARDQDEFNSRLRHKEEKHQAQVRASLSAAAERDRDSGERVERSRRKWQGRAEGGLQGVKDEEYRLLRGSPEIEDRYRHMPDTSLERGGGERGGGGRGRGGGGGGEEEGAGGGGVDGGGGVESLVGGVGGDNVDGSDDGVDDDDDDDDDGSGAGGADGGAFQWFRQGRGGGRHGGAWSRSSWSP